MKKILYFIMVMFSITAGCSAEISKPISRSEDIRAVGEIVKSMQDSQEADRILQAQQAAQDRQAFTDAIANTESSSGMWGIITVVAVFVSAIAAVLTAFVFRGGTIYVPPASAPHMRALATDNFQYLTEDEIRHPPIRIAARERLAIEQEREL